MNKFVKIIIVLTLLQLSLFRATDCRAQTTPAPTLEYVMTLHVTIDGAYSVGKTSFGERIAIPITGGTFEGPHLKGTIIPGGADWQLIDKNSNRTNLEAIYSIRTNDGFNIHVRNYGIIANGKNENGKDTFYFRCAPKFEAPLDSPYAWLNNAIFVCAPDFSGPEGTIILHVWMVK